MFNQVILIGNLGSDPDIRQTQNGDKVANFSLATSESWKDKNTGEKKTKSEWHKIVVFGATAGIVERYLKKGSKVMVQGKLTTRKWQDNNGQDRYTTEVILQGFSSSLKMLSSPNNQGTGNSGGQQYNQSNQQQYNDAYQQGYAPSNKAQQQNQQEVPQEFFDDEIPF